MRVNLQVVSKVFTHTLWDFFDNVMLLIGVNLLVLLSCIPVVTLPLGVAGAMYVSSLLIEEKPVRIRDFFIGAWRFGGRMYGLLLLDLAMVTILVLNGWFYASLPPNVALLGFIAFFICLWVGLFYFLGQIMVMALAVRDDLSFRQCLRAGYLLTIKNLPSAALVALQTILYWLVALLTIILFLLWGFSLPAVAFCNLLNAADGADQLGIKTRKDESRSLRHIFRPWED